MRSAGALSRAASLSRSRALIFSRSLATDFMRLESESESSRGIAIVRIVTTTAMATSSATTVPGSLSFS